MRGWRGTRTRWWTGSTWNVRARVERYVEPALLLLLRERPTHGYELLEQLPALTGERRVDMGNLYRILRSLEEEGLVTSEWNADEPGPAKRSYALTPEGERLLEQWTDALSELQAHVSDFLHRYEHGEEVNHVPRR